MSKMTFIVASDDTHQIKIVQWTRSPERKNRKIDVEAEWEECLAFWGLNNPALFSCHLVGAIKGHHMWMDEQEEKVA